MEDHRQRDWKPTRKYVSQQLQFRNPYFPRTTPVEKKSRRLKIYLWLGVIVLVGAVYLITFSSIFRINDIKVTGATADHESRIRQALTELLKEKRWLVIPGDNGLWVNPERLSQTIQDQLSNQASFKDMSIAKPKLKELSVTVKERTAELLWQVNPKEFFLLDSGGVVFSPITVSDEQPVPDLPLIKNVTKATTTINSEIITSAQAETIIATNQQLRQRFPELTVNYATPIIRESVRTVCTKPTTDSNTNSNTNSNRNLNTNSNTNRSNSSTKNANVSPANTNLNSNVASDTNTNLNLNPTAPCETEEVATSRYAKEILVNVAKDTDIYFSADESVESQINAIGVLLNEKIPDVNKISYIDVRYLPRAYYK
jgi:cell division septal protein FtsQ